MLKPTDEQLREIAAELRNAGWQARNALPDEREIIEGRAAFIASCRIALQEPTEQEMDAALKCDGRFKYGYSSALFANRLKSLTEPEIDPAVEAALKVIDSWVSGTILRERIGDLVAAVRNADKEASNGTL